MTHRTTATILVFAVMASCLPSAPPARTSAPLPRTVACGFASPESVVGAAGHYYVSNIGRELAPLAKDGDGFISELDERGDVVALRAFPRADEKLNAPKGLALVSNTLYTADIDRVVGFDRGSRAKVFEAFI